MKINDIKIVLDWVNLKYPNLGINDMSFDGLEVDVTLEDYSTINIHLDDAVCDLEINKNRGV